MLALANRPILPAPEAPVTRPAGRSKEETDSSRSIPAADDWERPTFLRALLRALGAIHT
jgi:hypothetical protein